MRREAHVAERSREAHLAEPVREAHPAELRKTTKPGMPAKAVGILRERWGFCERLFCRLGCQPCSMESPADKVVAIAA